MTPEPENFDALRRLLKLKRYEQPPPGYFNDFSRQVIAQIRAGGTLERDSFLDRLAWEVPWLQRLIESFQAKPALAVGFGAAACALLVGGLVYSERMEYAQPVPLVEIAPETTTGTLVVSPLAPVRPAEAAFLQLGTNNSMIPVIQPGGTLFDQFPPIKTELIGRRPAGQ